MAYSRRGEDGLIREDDTLTRADGLPHLIYHCLEQQPFFLRLLVPHGFDKPEDLPLDAILLVEVEEGLHRDGDLPELRWKRTTRSAKVLQVHFCRIIGLVKYATCSGESIGDGPFLRALQ